MHFSSRVETKVWIFDDTPNNTGTINTIIMYKCYQKIK